MKHKTFIGTVAVVALLLNMSLISFSFAASTTGSIDLNASGGINFVSVPSAQLFGTVVSSPVAQTLGPITFSESLEYGDLRGTQDPFDINVTASDFIQVGGTGVNPYGNISIRADGLTPSLTTINGGDCMFNTEALSVFLTFSGDAPYSQAINLVHGEAGVSPVAHCKFNPVIKIEIPSLQAPGTYQNTLIFSMI